MRCDSRDSKSARRFPISLALVALVASLGLAPLSLASQPAHNPRGHNPIEAHIFPPNLVMAHQSAIGLSEEQRRQIIAEVQQMESDLVPLHFEISEATQRLSELLSAPTVDEDKALALVDHVTELEGRVKRRHLTLVIRTKNLLTAEQQTRLRELRGEGRR